MTPRAAAVIGGRSVAVQSVSMERAIADPLASGGLTSASGEVVALEGKDVTGTVATPWDPGTAWPPVPDAPAQLDMTVTESMHRVLSGGRVVSATGGASSRAVNVTVADRYQSLDRTITWPASSDAIPALQEGYPARYVGMRSLALTDRILRHCGWYSTPPAMNGRVVLVPAQGTMEAEVGECIASIRYSDRGGASSWRGTPWGYGVQDVDAYFTPSSAFRLYERGQRVELIAHAGPLVGGTMSMEIQTTSGGAMRLSWTDSQITLWATNAGGSLTAITSVPRSVGMIRAAFVWLSNTTVRGELHAGGVDARSGSVAVSSTVTTAPMKQLRIVGTAIGGGFQVAYPSSGEDPMKDWTPNAHLYPRTANTNNLKAVPAVEGENCIDLLTKQCEAEAATFWINEDGVLEWWDLIRLEATAKSADLGSLDDIADTGFTWEHSWSSQKSRVTVAWQEPLRQWSSNASVDLWTGSGETVAGGGEPQEYWIKVPDDEVWLMPDLAPSRAGDSASGNMNRAVGSFYGGIVNLSDGREFWAQSQGLVYMSIEAVGGRTFKATLTWDSDMTMVQKTPSERTDSYLWMSRRNLNLPVLRGKSKHAFTGRETVGASTGPEWAPEFRIDAGWWIQDETQAQYIADYCAARVTVPQPVLSSVDLIPRFELRLGDMVEVRDEAVTRLTVRGLVISDSRSVDSSMGVRHSIAIRPLYVTRNGVTWEEWGEVMSRRTWQAWGDSQQPKSWMQWGASPLLGEEV